MMQGITCSVRDCVYNGRNGQCFSAGGVVEISDSENGTPECLSVKYNENDLKQEGDKCDEEV